MPLQTINGSIKEKKNLAFEHSSLLYSLNRIATQQFLNIGLCLSGLYVCCVVHEQFEDLQLVAGIRCRVAFVIFNHVTSSRIKITFLCAHSTAECHIRDAERQPQTGEFWKKKDETSLHFAAQQSARNPLTAEKNFFFLFLSTWKVSDKKPIYNCATSTYCFKRISSIGRRKIYLHTLSANP
jgi:hypothetical protein